MQFVVKFRNKTCKTPDEFPYVILTQDNWDDYGYKSTFSAELHLPDETLDLGPLKILYADQMSGYTPMPKESFESLGKDYYSLGGDLNYYEKLFKCGPRIYRTYLSDLPKGIGRRRLQRSCEGTIRGQGRIPGIFAAFQRCGTHDC